MLSLDKSGTLCSFFLSGKENANLSATCKEYLSSKILFFHRSINQSIDSFIQFRVSHHLNISQRTRPSNPFLCSMKNRMKPKLPRRNFTLLFYSSYYFGVARFKYKVNKQTNTQTTMTHVRGVSTECRRYH